MRRVAAALVTGPSTAAPPGVDPAAFALAMAEDVYDTLAGLELLTAGLVAGPRAPHGLDELVWPGTPLIRLPDDGSEPTRAALDQFAAAGADQAALVAADAPDLPPLLVGKLFRALGSAPVAVCPTADGRLVALAARLPAPGWLGPVDLDGPDAMGALAGAPRRRDVAVGPGWHRLTAPADLALLDPGLEGWDATRTLLSRPPAPAPDRSGSTTGGG
ncbi:hypothetical protein [Allonocardiopsis opalescens]|uniref:2-phospho-L-lactate guanylyltransferase n=1 Tax=Allonocardiopsis opalescens TaxID=1144618 RepID=A0A2T0QDL5_9ACTN|nr:hypothetical protein [Allonocardiopsis opalescens]PRY02027.1 hypothetical protein CLV72_101625 [Allonocardiopsis opalescens]